MVNLWLRYSGKFGLIVTTTNKFYRGKIISFADGGIVVLDDIKEGTCIFFPHNIERLKILRSKIDINDMLNKMKGWEEELRKEASQSQIDEVEEHMKQRA
jgi:hypothetical protein